MRTSWARAGGIAGSRGVLPTLTALVLLLICLVFTFVLAAWHRDVGRVLGASGESVAAAVAGEVDRNIELLGFSLSGVAEHWNSPDVQALAPRLRDMVLFDNAMRAPGFGAIVVLDGDGRVKARSTDKIQVGEAFGDRDYFRVHVGVTGIGLYVSKPFRSRISGRWIVALSRRIDDAQGGFAGVAVGTIELDYLNKLYAGLGIGAGNAVTLFRTDGTVVTREPFVSSDVRLWAGGGDAFTRMRWSRDGNFEGPSPIDGRRRIISYHRIGDLPLIQVVEVSGEGDYAVWWRRAAAVSGLLTLLCLGVLVLSLVLARELGRRSAAEDELSRVAGTDALTGIANRRRFESVLAEEWRRAADVNGPMALLMVDADAFKSYNDLFGHPAGDLVLKAIAGRLDAGARARGGLACRFGGEEFVVVIPGCDERRALLAAEDLRTSVEALALPHPRGIGGVVTISVGVAAAWPSDGGSGHELLAASDAALYQAKAEGRNRCRMRQDVELRAA